MSIHSIVENRILDQITPEGEEAERFREHLTECASCAELDRRVRERMRLFRDAPMKVPMSGFTERWLAFKQKREKETLQRENLNMLAILAVLIGITALTCAVILLVPGYGHRVMMDTVNSLATMMQIGMKAGVVLNTFREPLMFIGGLFTVGVLLYGVLIFSSMYHIFYRTRRERLTEYVEPELE